MFEKNFDMIKQCRGNGGIMPTAVFWNQREHLTQAKGWLTFILEISHKKICHVVFQKNVRGFPSTVQSFNRFS